MNESTFKVNSSFVSERISEIRFIDDQNCLEPELFVSASESSVNLWKLISNQFNDEVENEFTPKVMSKLPVEGYLTGLETVDHNNLVTSSASGISLIYINRDIERNNMRENHRFKGLHKFPTGDPALCTGLSIHEDCIATVGEDGRVVILSMSGQKVMLELEKADSVTQTTVNFINYKELITGNRLGIMKCFDLRSGSQEPTAVLAISCEDEKKSNSVTCIANHPTQQHIVLAGSEEGSITVYDLRQPTYPASYLCAHESAITELKFHPTQPDKLFSASANGELWKWTQNMMQTIPQEYDNKNPLESVNPWLNGERAKKNVNITTVLGGLRKSVTSLDCSKRSRLVCSCNNEAVYLIDNVF